MSAIDPATIAKLLAGEKKSRARKPKTQLRNYDTWFDLLHKFDQSCEIEDHEDNVDMFTFFSVEDRTKAMKRNRAVAEVNGKMMCRYCFIAGANSEEAN